MNKDINSLPKKNPLSLQLNLQSFETATEDEKVMQQRMRESTTFFKDGIRRFRKNKIAMTCFFIVVIITLIAIFVPMFYPYSYEEALDAKQGELRSGDANDLRPFEYSESELERIEAG